MTIELTQQEQDYLNNCFNGYVINESYTSPVDEQEGLTAITLPSNRTANAIYHYHGDSLTVFRIDEAPTPPAMEKLAIFLNQNPDVKQLLGL